MTCVLTTNTRFGDVVDHGYIDVAVWRQVLDASGSPTGYIQRERWKTVGEVLDELMEHLDVWECDNCHEQFAKYHGDTFDCYCCGKPDSLSECVDEYFGLAGMLGRDTEWPHGKHWSIIAHASTGGNEGHRYDVAVVVHDRPSTYIPVFGGKTFRGMEHALDMVARIVRLMGL